MRTRHFYGTFSYIKHIGLTQFVKMSHNAIVQGQACKQRMVWYNITDDEYDWNWERSDDSGKTWDVKWQIKYRRKK